MVGISPGSFVEGGDRRLTHNAYVGGKRAGGRRSREDFHGMVWAAGRERHFAH